MAKKVKLELTWIGKDERQSDTQSSLFDTPKTNRQDAKNAKGEKSKK